MSVSGTLTNLRRSTQVGLSFAWRYGLAGAAFGALFPIASTLATLASRGMPPTLQAAGQLQMGEPLLWVIDTAPFFLGMVASMAGRREDRLRRLAAALRQDQETLEREAAHRTRQLSAAAEISRRLSTILDPRQLAADAAEHVRSAFGYYHALIYLFDERGERLTIAGGTGEAGKALMARGYSLPKGQGLVGRAAETNAAVLAPDAAQDPRWQPNPLLPATQAEVAVPIALGQRVLGVLNVQHNVVNGLHREDADLLLSIASQLAVALQNARFYTQAQQQAEGEALINTIAQKIQSATSLDDVLRVAVRELGQALDAPRATVELGVARPMGGAPPIGPAEPAGSNGRRPGQ